MKDTRFISYTVDNDLCMGCGVCEDVCPTSALEMSRDKSGILIPFINYNSCINEKGCNICFKVCSGHGLEIKKIGDSLNKNITTKKDKYIGDYTSTYTGYSTDYDIRYHASSGGMVSQFIIYLLDKKIIDGAVLTDFDDKDNITPRPFIATTKEEVLKARSSKYCPVSLNQMGNEIKKREGKYLVVGLPCHIHSFRKRELIDKKLRERIFGYFTIFCSGNRSYEGRDYLLSLYKIKPSNLSYFAFRDDGCLGSMKAIEKDGRLTTVPYLEYYGKLRSYFKPNRCNTCVDHYGVLADINFGDIHTGKYIEDKVGVNSIIVRNEKFDKLLRQAAAENYVILDDVAPEVINKSQKTMLYPKMKKVKLIMDMNKILKMKSPIYDIEISGKYNFKDVLSFFFMHFQRFVGSRRYLWPLIKLIGNKKDSIE